MGKQRRRLGGWVGGSVAASLLIGLVLYSGSGRPLGSGEVETLLERIASQNQKPGGRHDLAALRRFLEHDDGRPFYTVNLYAFHERARYDEGPPAAESGREAFERFSRVMLGLLARRASHPVFGSDWTDTESKWDRIVIVRYRSRRDIAEIFASPEFAEASAHKWAAIARHERMLVQGLHIPELHVPAILVVVMSGALMLEAALARRAG